MPAPRTTQRIPASRTTATRATATRAAAPRTTPARTTTARTDASRAATARTSARGRAGTPVRPVISAREAQALRALLAARQAAGAPTDGAGTATAGVRRPTSPNARPPARRTSTGGRPATRRAPARRRSRRPAAERTGARWSTRLTVVTAGILALPVLASLALPGPQTPQSGGGADITALALATQSTLLQQADRYRRLESELAQHTTALGRAQEAEQAALAQADAERAVVGATAAALYRAAPGTRPAVFPTAPPAEQTTAAALARAQQAGAALADAARGVSEAEQQVASVAARAADVLARSRTRTAALDPEVVAGIAGLGTTPSAGDQQTRNQRAVARWQGYLTELAAAGVELPTAAELADPDALPAGLSPALNDAGEPVPGVAWAVVGSTPTTVLPAETVTAVSGALAQLGKPFTPGATGPDGYDCGGLTSASWLLAGYAVPTTPAEQWARGAAVPTSDLQVGDLVLSPGGLDVGLYVGGGEVLGASAAGYQVGIRSLPAGASAVRVTLPAPAEPNAALPPADGAMACGAIPPPLPTAPKVSPAWGGWSNGQIPSEVLCRIGVFSHALRCDAAASYQAMSAAYADHFGKPLCITDSYRPFAAQVTAFAVKPHLAALPGTSNHGWALAVDLCGGINSFGTPQWRWMAENAGRFGWVQPSWAGPHGEKPEPWHWEYGVIS